MRNLTLAASAGWLLTALILTLGFQASAAENCISKCHRELVACAEADCAAYDEDTGECVEPEGGPDSPCYAAYDQCPALCKAERKKKADEQ